MSSLQQLGVAITQPVGVGEQETGQAARGDDGPVPFGSALGDVAVEQVEAAGVAELFDLAEQLEDRDCGVGGAPLPQVIAVRIDEGGQ